MVDLDQYRCRIGQFFERSKSTKSKIKHSYYKVRSYKPANSTSTMFLLVNSLIKVIVLISIIMSLSSSSQNSCQQEHFWSSSKDMKFCLNSNCKLGHPST